MDDRPRRILRPVRSTCRAANGWERAADLPPLRKGEAVTMDESKGKALGHRFNELLDIYRAYQNSFELALEELVKEEVAREREVIAVEMEKDHIVFGSIGPLMDAGYTMACDHWAKMIRSRYRSPGLPK